MQTPLPLRRFEVLHASNFEYVRNLVGHVFLPHDLILMDVAQRIDARLHSRRLLDTSLSFITYGASVLGTCGQLDTFYTVTVSISGTTGFRSRDISLLLTKDLGTVVSPAGDNLAMYWEPRSSLLVFRIERPSLEAHLSGLLGQHLPRPLRFEAAMPQDRGGGKLVSARIRSLARDLDRGRPIYDHRLTTHAFEQSVMSEILFAQRHNYTLELEGDVSAVGSREVRQAVELLESHPEWPLSLTKVAKMLSVSARSLQRRFREELDTTFRGVLHSIRLRRVHDDLVRSNPDVATVNDILARWGLPLEGYTFAAYQRQHSETPAETLRR